MSVQLRYVCTHCGAVDSQEYVWGAQMGEYWGNKTPKGWRLVQIINPDRLHTEAMTTEVENTFICGDCTELLIKDWFEHED